MGVPQTSTHDPSYSDIRIQVKRAQFSCTQPSQVIIGIKFKLESMHLLYSCRVAFKFSKTKNISAS
jgi:hypothetical protein